MSRGQLAARTAKRMAAGVERQVLFLQDCGELFGWRKGVS